VRIRKRLEETSETLTNRVAATALVSLCDLDVSAVRSIERRDLARAVTVVGFIERRQCVVDLNNSLLSSRGRFTKSSFTYGCAEDRTGA
jgi:hypothetical protein